MKPYVLFCLVFFGLAVSSSFAQGRDYLTDDETEKVRDAQQIDARMEVLIHAIDRRFAALKVDVSTPAPAKKLADDWGADPTGTRLQLLYDIKRILQKAIDDIDNLAEKPDALVPDEPKKGEKVKTYSELFPRAVRLLASAAERYRQPLKAQLDVVSDGAEKGSVLDALDMCSQITTAVMKLPKETVTVKKKGN